LCRRCHRHFLLFGIPWPERREPVKKVGHVRGS
jgi:hypothetical protein